MKFSYLPIPALWLAALLLAPAPIVRSQTVSEQSRKLAADAVKLRRENSERAATLLREADATLQNREYKNALDQYRQVIALVPTPSSQTAYLQSRAYDGVARCLIELAREDAAAGRLDEARNKADEARSFAPKDAAVVRAREEIYASMGITIDKNGMAVIEDNPAVRPGLLRDIYDVNAALRAGDDYLATGQFDAAEQKYQEIIVRDPYNTTARLRMKKVVEEKKRYADVAKESTRAERLSDIDRHWELPIPREVIARTTGGPVAPISKSTVAEVEKLLKSTTVEQVAFDQAGIGEVIEFLNAQARSKDIARKGVQFVARLDAATITQDVTMSGRGMPIYDILKYATQLAGVKFAVEEYAVTILPLTAVADQLITKEYRLAADFFSTRASAAGENPDDAAGGGGRRKRGGGLGAGMRIERDVDVRDFLKAKGLKLDAPGVRVIYSKGSSTLTLRSTPEDIELMDLMNSAPGTTTPQVSIESRMVEINQKDLDELSVAMNLVQNGNYTYADVDPSSLLFQDQMNGLNSLDGLRSSASLRNNGIDVLLTQNSAGDALTGQPNYFNFMVQVNQLNADVMLRALAQKKSSDLLVAPNVIARSGENAKIKIIRRMFYPTSFEAPELPTQQQLTSGNNVLTAPPTIKPAQPTDFQEKEVGVTMDVRPQVGPDNYTIDLDIVPTITEFDGFVNYGTPLTAPFSGQNFVLSDNVQNVPIFTVRRIKTSVQVFDGHTLVLGGLIKEDTQTIHDKVPILGDIPLLGRMFRSKVEQSIKRNLMIFVTPKIVTPTGELLNPPEPLILPATLSNR